MTNMKSAFKAMRVVRGWVETTTHSSTGRQWTHRDGFTAREIWAGAGNNLRLVCIEVKDETGHVIGRVQTEAELKEL